MSQRFGMADGRCFTLNQSNQLLYEAVAAKFRINPLDSGLLRTTLQSSPVAEQAVTGFVGDQVPSCGIINYVTH
jgi:hypothetical protein